MFYPTCFIFVESLDELADMVVPLFSGVDNKNVEAPEWLEHPYGDEQVRVCIEGATSISHSDTLLISA